MRVLAQDALFPDWRITENVGSLVEGFIDVIEPLLDFLKYLINDILVANVEWLLVGPPPIVVIVVFAAIAWWAKGWKLALGTFAGFWFMEAIGFFEQTMESLAMVLVAAVIAILIGIPVGIWAARSSAVSAGVRPVLDFMQTMPSFVYLLIAVAMFSIGAAPGVAASVVFAMPPAVRLTELGIRQVDGEVVEAARAFGARPGEILRQVQLPLARPSIMAGVNQVIMLSLSMVVIGGLAGGGGVAGSIVEGVQRVDRGLGVVAGLAVVALAIFLDRVTSGFGSVDDAHRQSG